jgi:hypothetical protein
MITEKISKHSCFEIRFTGLDLFLISRFEFRF